jgi:pimeloyl-ACP methyl ester carboxylesterase
MRVRFGLDFNKIAPVNNIHSAHADILLVHGDEDPTVPLTQGKALLEAGNPETTHLWAVPGKGHSDCHTHPHFWEKIESFLQETLPINKKG